MQKTTSHATGPISAKITLPGSKCMTRRALLLAALADGVSEIASLCIDDDTRTYVNALHQLGIVVQLDEKNRTCTIAGGNGQFPKKQANIWCSGTPFSVRFLLAACAATQGDYYFDCVPALRKQSFLPLLTILSRQGTQLIPSDAHQMPFTVVGSDSLEGGEIKLDHTVTGHSISALLMIAPYARSPFSFTIDDLANQPHVGLTCAMMADFGVLVHRVHQGQFMVPVPQRYQPKDYVIEPDLSLAVYFFAAAAITGGEITIQYFDRTKSKQTDVKFLAILEKMGCSVQESPQGLTLVGASELEGIEVSLREFSDSFMALIAIAPFAKSAIRITHIGPLHKKELYRMLAAKEGLTKVGIHVETGDDWIKIFPGTPKAATINSHHDSRMTYAFSVLGLKAKGITVEHTDEAEQRYPEFFTTLDSLQTKRLSPEKL